MFRILQAALAALLVTSANADEFVGSFYCTEEFGGGISYDERAGKWRSTTFTAEERFMLRVSEPEDTNEEFAEYKIVGYNVAISSFGSNFITSCFSPYSSNAGLVEPIGSLFICEASLTQYRIDLATLRFLSSYQIGFTSGLDNNDNTPSMMGGTCVRVQ